MTGPVVLLVGAVGGEVAEQLGADGFDTEGAASADHALALTSARSYDAIVLGDFDDPRESLTLLAALRGDESPDGDIPVVVASARAAPADVLRAFDLGADDFVAAPAGYLELRARLRALLRRSGGSPRRRMRVGAIDIDLASRAVCAGGTPVRLSRLEYELLTALAADPGRVFTKEELLRRVWGFRALGKTRTLDSHACRLRRKLGGAIVTVWGVGYRLAG